MLKVQTTCKTLNENMKESSGCGYPLRDKAFFAATIVNTSQASKKTNM
jgi:hypothetical protein